MEAHEEVVNIHEAVKALLAMPISEITTACITRPSHAKYPERNLVFSCREGSIVDNNLRRLLLTSLEDSDNPASFFHDELTATDWEIGKFKNT